jgi:hypothetical protein
MGRGSAAQDDSDHDALAQLLIAVIIPSVFIAHLLNGC